MTKACKEYRFQFGYPAIDPKKLLGILTLVVFSIFGTSVQAAAVKESISSGLEFESEFMQDYSNFDIYIQDSEISQSGNAPTQEFSDEEINKIAQQGFVLLRIGKKEEGIKFLQLAWDKAPKYRKLGVIIAFAHLKAKEFGKTLEVAKKLQDQNPDKPEGFVLAGYAHTGLKQHEMAKSSYQQALKIRPRAPDAANQLAYYDQAEGNFESAKELLEDVLVDHPAQKQTLKQLAEVEYKLGNHQQTVALLQKAVATYPDDIGLQVKLAQLYLVLGEQKKARQISEKALDQAPENPLLILMKGVALLNDNQPESAIKTLKELIQLSPQTFEPHYYLAKSYEQLKQYGSALKAVDSALALSPEYTASLFLKARLLAKSGKLDEAETLLADLAEKNPNNIDIFELQGKVALAKNKPAQAINFYQQALKIKETNSFIVQLAKAQFQAGKENAALATLTTWLDKIPDDVLSRVMLAEMLYMLDRYDDALIEVEKVAIKQPNNQRMLQVKKAILTKMDK